MGAYRFTNNAESTLSGAITAGATSLTVASASAFPTAGNFTIVVDAEIMLVTGVAGATFTVVRGQEGTSAATHALGAIVRHVVTADALKTGLVPNGTTFPTGPSTNDRFYRTDRAQSYYFDGTRWLTEQVFVVTLGDDTVPRTANYDFSVAIGLEPDADILVTRWSVVHRTGSPQNGSNYWTYTLYRDFTFTSIDTFSTSAFAADTWFRTTRAVLHLVGSSDVLFTMRAVKTGAPASGVALVQVEYRKVG